MRTSILAAATLGLLAAACTGGIDDVGGGGGGGDDTGGGPSCGDGIMDSGEACDDGNTLGGDGCSAACTVEAVPRVELTLDKTSVTTDLEVESTIVVTATSVMGFAGDVTLTATAVDAGDAALAGWSAVLDTATLSLTDGGTATANLTLKIPGDAAALMGNIKVSAASTAAPAIATTAVTANPVVAVSFTAANNACAYPNRLINNPFRIKAGRTIKVTNDTTRIMTVHVSAGMAGFSHQQGTMNPGASYTGTPTRSGDQVDFYCHSDAAGQIPDPAGAQHPYLRVVD